MAAIGYFFETDSFYKNYPKKCVFRIPPKNWLDTLIVVIGWCVCVCALVGLKTFGCCDI